MEKVVNTTLQLKRGTTAAWVKNKDYIPAEGEPCLDLTTGLVKYGDGKTTYENLKSSGLQASHYEGVKQTGESDNDVFNRVLTELGVTPNKDDIFVIKSLIAGDKYSYTAFVYDGANWAAMDGNYSAKNVFCEGELTVTSPIGVITQDKINEGNGSVKHNINGMNIQDALASLTAEEEDPAVDNPSVSFSVSGGSGEVGTSYTLPTAKVKITDVGSYTYGSKDANNNKYEAADTGVTFAIGDVTITQGENSKSNTSAMVKDSELTLQATGSDTLYKDTSVSYKFTATAEYTASDRVPITNLGNKVEDLKIGNGSVTLDDQTATFTGWRKMFMGTITDNSKEINSALIRGLTLINKQVSTTAQTFTAPVGATKIIVACPAAYVVSKIEYFTMSWEDFAGFDTTPTTVQVADARGGENGLTNYNVYTFTHANPTGFEAATQFRVTLKKA